VSLSGKVSIEMSFECVRPDWAGGRGACNINGNHPNQGPPPNVNTKQGVDLLLDRYGLTDKELALITIGGHAVKKAEFKPWVFGGTTS
jgi:hypothetical protein